MGSLDVDSLFTDIPLDDTIDICFNQLFENNDTLRVLQSQNLKVTMFGYKGVLFCIYWFTL